MGYEIIISPRAQKEIENSIDYYALNSLKAPSDFVAALMNAYEMLKYNPWMRIRYNNIRSIKLKKFPYSLYFIIAEKQKAG